LGFSSLGNKGPRKKGRGGGEKPGNCKAKENQGNQKKIESGAVRRLPVDSSGKWCAGRGGKRRWR